MHRCCRGAARLAACSRVATRDVAAVSVIASGLLLLEIRAISRVDLATKLSNAFAGCLELAKDLLSRSQQFGNAFGVGERCSLRWRRACVPPQLLFGELAVHRRLLDAAADEVQEVLVHRTKNERNLAHKSYR